MKRPAEPFDPEHHLTRAELDVIRGIDRSDPAATIAALRREVATLRAALEQIGLRQPELDLSDRKAAQAHLKAFLGCTSAARAALAERPDGE